MSGNFFLCGYSGRLIKILLWLLFLFLSVYYNVFSFSGNVRNYLIANIHLIKHINHTQILKYNGTEDFLINTPGCYIPNYGKTIQFVEGEKIKKSCGVRAVFVEKSTDDTIKFRIDTARLNKYGKKNDNISCCYKFAVRSDKIGKEDTNLRYTTCKEFKSGTEIYLKHEVIVVTCSRIRQNKTKSKTELYKDSYLVLKKNLKVSLENSTERPWNVLMLGMDTMSRARFYVDMPKTGKYFKANKWIDFRGYHKVASNTFPNLMAFLTARNPTLIYKLCAKGMYECNDILIWSKFKGAGFSTAYGEDFLDLPDTFSPYKGFRKLPTDHYTRPLFLTGEDKKGNLVCTGKKPSALHLLDYASEFANAYKNNKFFGLFWLNSYSHNIINLPSLIDENTKDFFENLNKSGVLDNTFVFFLSDHGIRFGPKRKLTDAYFEERLPTLFLWIPPKFRELYSDKYYNLRVNENRLITPYDLHATLWDIMQLSNSSVKIVPPAECPKCSSIFEEMSEYRRCSEAGVSEKWCSCHRLIELPLNDSEGQRSLQTAVSHIQSTALNTSTTKCNVCHPLKLQTVFRIHYYIGETSKKYFVVAFDMTPGNLEFEATLVKESDDSFRLLLPTYTMTPYNSKGYCVIRRFDREHCVCKKLEKCSSK